MAKTKNIVLLSAKVYFPSNGPSEEEVGMVIQNIALRANPRGRYFKPHGDEEQAEFEKNPKEFLKKSLKSLDPNNSPQFIYVGDFEDRFSSAFLDEKIPHYFLTITPGTKPEAQLQEEYRKKHLVSMLNSMRAYCGPEMIQPLSKAEQKIVDTWFAGRKD